MSQTDQRDEQEEVTGDIRVDLVGFTTGHDGGATRAVVLIEAALATHSEQHRQHQTTLRRLCQYRTLGFDEGLWTVLKIDERDEGKHHLSAPLGRAMADGQVTPARAVSPHAAHPGSLGQPSREPPASSTRALTLGCEDVRIR